MSFHVCFPSDLSNSSSALCSGCVNARVLAHTRSYAITPAGRERFLSLLLTPSASSRDTPEEFVIKLTKFQFLTPAQRVMVLEWYRSYQDTLRSSYQEARDYVRHNPEITDGERAWIMRSIDYRLHRAQAERSWLDQQIAGAQDAGRR
jgi:hypothetical protein